MELSFTLQHTNLMLVLCSLVVIFYILSKKFSKRRAIMFGNFETLKKVAGKKFLNYSAIPIFLRMFALILIILSISDPAIVISTQASNTDYALVVDTSSSMLTPDIAPNRLEATRSAVTRFIKENTVSSFGIVTFSGEARIRSGLTKDLLNLTETIDEIEVDNSAGTAIGEAMIVASTLFADSNKNKTILLITDGRNNRGIDLNNTYVSLVEKNIHVVSIGLGKTTYDELEIPEELKNLNATQAEFPVIYEEELISLSNATNGAYYPVTDMKELESAVKKAIQMEVKSVNIQFYLLLFACAVLLFGWSLEMTKYRVIP